MGMLVFFVMGLCSDPSKPWSGLVGLVDRFVKNCFALAPKNRKKERKKDKEKWPAFAHYLDTLVNCEALSKHLVPHYRPGPPCPTINFFVPV